MAQATEWTLGVEGLRELQRTLRKVDPEAKKALTKAGRTAGNIVRDHARRKTAPRRSGRLAKGVQTFVSGASVNVGTGKRQEYAGPINFGWPARSMSAALAGSSSRYWSNVGKKGVRGIEASHFLEEAVHDKWPDVKEAYENGVRAVIQSVSTD
jgi:hypothetical protein